MVPPIIHSREMGSPDMGQTLPPFYRGGTLRLRYLALSLVLDVRLSAQLGLSARPALPLVNARGPG